MLLLVILILLSFIISIPLLQSFRPTRTYQTSCRPAKGRLEETLSRLTAQGFPIDARRTGRTLQATLLSAHPHLGADRFHEN